MKLAEFIQVYLASQIPFSFSNSPKQNLFQNEELLFLIIWTTHSKRLSLRHNIVSITHEFNGPLLFIIKCTSHLRGRTVEGKPEGLNPHGKKKPFKFPE